MIHALFCISLYVVASFILQSFLAEISGHWFAPNLLIIVVVFFNLYRGIRYGFLAAIMGGLLWDSFSAQHFGWHTFSLILCAHIASFSKMYLYHSGSLSSRVLMVFLISLIYSFIQYLLNVMVVSVSFEEAFTHVMVPEILATTVAAAYFLEKFKQCALRLFA